MAFDVEQLDNYMDEVNGEALALDRAVGKMERDGWPKTPTGASFDTNAWTSFMDHDLEEGFLATPAVYVNGLPIGWNAFFADNRNLIARMAHTQTIFRTTEDYERRLGTFHDQFLAAGAKPKFKRPEPGSQSPDKGDDELKDIAKWALGAFVLAQLVKLIRG